MISSQEMKLLITKFLSSINLNLQNGNAKIPTKCQDKGGSLKISMQMKLMRTWRKCFYKSYTETLHEKRLRPDLFFYFPLLNKFISIENLGEICRKVTGMKCFFLISPGGKQPLNIQLLA